MKPPRFLISSTGRSGSLYISKVLTKAGIPTGHERYYPSPMRKQRGGMIGESSCFSVPHLDEFEGVIFHQTRNPLHVLTSLYENRKRIKRVTPVKKYRYSFIEPTGDDMKDFMRMIVRMNEKIEQYAVKTYKIESLDMGMLEYIITRGVGGNEFRSFKSNSALKRTPTDTHKHHNVEYLTWDDLEDCKEKSQLQEMSKRYGYT